jgi:GLPGLI family protein
MGKILFVLLCLFISHITIAQNLIFPPFPKDVSNITTIDSANIRVWYALNAEDISKPETYDDMQRLEIGAHLSKYYSYFVYNSDSLCTDWGKKHKGTQSAPNWMGPRGKDSNWSEYYFSEYFKDFTNNVITEYARMPRNIPNYQYSENIPSQNWKIQADTLTVRGYLCQKAICQFRGREYIAWFTPDIPINNGPWKFGGLPGLILKIYDDDNQYIFECIRVENHKKKYPIKIYDYKNYMKIDRHKLLKLQKEVNENYFKVAGWVLINNSSKPRQEVPYHPIELE